MDLTKCSAMVVLLGLSCGAACANGASFDPASAVTDDGDAATAPAPEDASASIDAGPSGTGLGASPTGDAGAEETKADAATTDAGAKVKDAGTIDAGATCNVVLVNELQADGTSAADEFVELYNPSPACVVSLDGLSLGYLSANGNGNGAGKPIVYFTGAKADTIAPHGYFVIAGSAFAGTKDGTLTGGLAAAGGRVGIMDVAGTVLDSVGYGTATAGALVEASPAKCPPSSQSIGRVPNGKTTSDNAMDFAVLTTPTPGAPN